MRHHLTSIRMATIKGKKKNTRKQKITSGGKDVEKLNPCAELVGVQNGIASVKSSMAVPQKMKSRITI